MIIEQAWQWAKKNPWKAAVFPLVILGIILTWLFAGERKTLQQVIVGTLDEDARKATQAKDNAIREYKNDLKKVEDVAREKLSKASKEQLDELEKVRKENPDGVAKWINDLS